MGTFPKQQGEQWSKLGPAEAPSWPAGATPSPAERRQRAMPKRLQRMAHPHHAPHAGCRSGLLPRAAPPCRARPLAPSQRRLPTTPRAAGWRAASPAFFKRRWDVDRFTCKESAAVSCRVSCSQLALAGRAPPPRLEASGACLDLEKLRSRPPLEESQKHGERSQLRPWPAGPSSCGAWIWPLRESSGGPGSPPPLSVARRTSPGLAEPALAFWQRRPNAGCRQTSTSLRLPDQSRALAFSLSGASARGERHSGERRQSAEKAGASRPWPTSLASHAGR